MSAQPAVAHDTNGLRAGDDAFGPERRLAFLDAVAAKRRDMAGAIAMLDREILGELPLPDGDTVRRNGPFPSQGAYFRSSLRDFGELFRHSALHPDARVLDYGCGLGRMAVPFAAYLDPTCGAYCGVDTKADCIDFAQAAFSRMPHVRFAHADIRNGMYNQGGGGFERFADLDLGGPFDLVFLLSVFTHLLPADHDALLRELHRRLRPGGELLASWFLLDDRTRKRIDAGEAQRGFPHVRDGAFVEREDIPEWAVAYEASDVRARLEGTGFEVRNVRLGHWRGIEASHGQDLVLAVKR